MKTSTVIKKSLAVLVALGAAYSFFFWLPATQVVIAEYGIVTAMYSTHLPRLILDVATIMVCVALFLNAND